MVAGNRITGRTDRRMNGRGNAFVRNRTEVKYVSTGWVRCSGDGQRNHRSGIADVPYRPNDSMDHVLWTQPAAKMLLGSPAVQLVRWSQASLPALLPGHNGAGKSMLLKIALGLTPADGGAIRIAILRDGRLVANDTLRNLSRRAGLPTRLRILVRGGLADRLAAETGGTRVNGASVEVECAPDAKMDALRRFAAMPEFVEDIEMTPPGLEDLYRHFAQEQGR